MRVQEALRILAAAVAGALVLAVVFLIVGSILVALAIAIPVLVVLAIAVALLSGRASITVIRDGR